MGAFLEWTKTEFHSKRKRNRKAEIKKKIQVTKDIVQEEDRV
jgi:hypothetical protein